MEIFSDLFLTFITYSFLGWIIESVYCSIGERKIINRGFLIGPYCPIYGFAAVLIVVFLSKYNNNILLLFSLSVLFSGIIEYITSYVLERIFKLSLWDYSSHKFNLNGRICLKNLILFGILAILVIKVINPVIEIFYSTISEFSVFVIFVISLVAFTIDLILTVMAVLDIRELSNTTLNLDELTIVRNGFIEELEYKGGNFVHSLESKGESIKNNIGDKTEYLRNTIKVQSDNIIKMISKKENFKLNFIHKRFIKAFPNLKPLDKNKSFNLLKNKIKNLNKK
ncbi:putative ABC transporter permease [Miniphocaeibacter halophilus]|uniref:ABC transporter permease n=1 Tax=Miniphocaeibacter halophilus TaxID=2931922 RepID=A0AC61MSM9_9FIRM|nr:putative ABC transporter permease [Miniphocaeibacter halophilus]QQK08556.1 putative ABC transporter permease [Miniphocaeibacter halophilus]